MEQKEERKLYTVSDEAKMEATKLLASMSPDLLIEFTAITRHSAIYLACMMGLSDLRKWMVAVGEYNELKLKDGDISEELEESIKPFFLSDRILNYYYRLQKSVGGFNIQEMYKIAQAQVEGGVDEDILGNVDQKIFGELK